MVKLGWGSQSMMVSVAGEDVVFVALKTESPSRIEWWAFPGACGFGGGGGGCSSIWGKMLGRSDRGWTELVAQSMMVSLEVSEGPGDAV